MRSAGAGRPSGPSEYHAIASGKRKAEDVRPGKAGKPSWAARKREQAREALEVGTLALTEPRRLPGRLYEILRRAFRRAWATRGGGLYATGVFVSFCVLETRSLVGEFVSSGNAGDFITGQVADLLLRFSVASVQNTVYALIWPVLLVGRFGLLWGGGALAAIYVVFAGFLQRPLERWLFEGAADEQAGDNEDARK